jgi:uncharacterized protein (TIGR02757 family)
MKRARLADDASIARALDDVRARCDARARREVDPVGVVHRYDDPADQEIVGLVAACIAFGNVKTIRQKLEDILRRLAPHPSRIADDPDRVRAKMDGFYHRVFLGEDIAALVIGARKVQRESGSLGARFVSELEAARATGADSPMREALACFCQAIRDAGGLKPHPIRRGPAHLLPNPRGGSSGKRLFLYLRWMIRPADGIDLGLWNVDPSLLLCPVDVHIHKLSRNLGFTRRTDLSWRTAEEITRALARFDPADPVKYDFSLCHLGMLQRCPSRRDEKRCEGCGVMPVCRHWQGRSAPPK